MLYDSYQQKIQKIARGLAFLRKHAVKLILSVVFVTGLVTILCITKGMVGEITCQDTVIYGEKIVCKADVFLGSVRYEFKGEDGQWSTNAPIYPGVYSVRATGKSITGAKTYGEEKQFTILPKTVTVSVLEDSVIYGEQLTATAKTVYKDNLVCDQYVYADILSRETEVWADPESIVILDDKGNDVTFAYVVQSEKKKVSILPRSLSVTVADSEKEYDGIRFAFDQYEISGGTLVNGDVLQATFTASRTEVGSVVNLPELQIVRSDGSDVTHHYSIRESFGILRVNKRQLIVTAGSMTVEYDGNEHTHSVATVSDKTPLAEGHQLVIEDSVTVRNAGVHENLMKLSVVDDEGVSKNNNYSILIEKGTITIDHKVLTVQTESETWMYDGNPHYNSDVSVAGLLDGHTILLSSSTTVTNHGSAENMVDIVVRDEEGKSVTANYRFEYNCGTLTVTKRPIVIRPKAASDVYTGMPVYMHSYTIESDIKLATGHKIKVISATILYNAGSEPNIFKEFSILDAHSNDVTDNYEVEQINDRNITILQRKITLRPEDVEEYYCGERIFPEKLSYGSNTPYTLLVGHEAEATFLGSSINVTKTPVQTYINEVHIYDGQGGDVTSNYEVICETGSLVINPRPILIKIPDTEKIYDDVALTSYMCYELLPVSPLTTALASKDMLSPLTLTGSITEVGSVKGQFKSCVIKDSITKKDVTENYDIRTEDGTLTVLPRPIMVQSGSASKPYDGSPLVCHDPIQVVTGSLAQNHILSMDAVGTITEVGRVPNTITGRILKFSHVTWGSYVDVSHNYEITYSEGKLTVYANNEIDGGGGGGNGSGSGSGGSGVDTSGNLSGAGDMLENSDKNTTVLRIKSEYSGSIYLRLKSFGDFSGTAWKEATEYPLLIDGKYSYNYLPSVVLEYARKNQATLMVQSYTKQYLLPYYLSMSDVGYDVQTSDVFYEGNGMTEYSVPYYVYSGLGTELRGLMNEEYSSLELAYREYVYNTYLTVDATTFLYMNEVINSQGFTASDPQIYQKVAAYIQNAATYNLEYDRGLDKQTNIAVAFLKTYKEGVCVHYATAATLLFRSLGIPARYVIGFAGATLKDQWSEIRSPGHAWTEVYIDGVGWMAIEVTGGGAGSGGAGGIGGEDGSGEGSGEEKPILQISPAYQSKIHDGTPLYAKDILDIGSELDALLRMGYSYEVKVDGERTDVGKGISTIKSFTLYDADGKDVTDEFYIHYLPGTLEVFVSDTNVVKVYLHRLQKYYDGKELCFGEDDYTVLQINEGDELHLSLTVSLTDVGYLTLSDLNRNIAHYANYSIYRDGEDITNNCRLVFVSRDGNEDSYIPISVDKRPLELTANSHSKVYDGKVLISSGASITKGSLAELQTIEPVRIVGNISEVGVKRCYVLVDSIVIKDEKGIDVTSNYAITTKDGTLTVIEKP